MFNAVAIYFWSHILLKKFIIYNYTIYIHHLACTEFVGYLVILYLCVDHKTFI